MTEKENDSKKSGISVPDGVLLFVLTGTAVCGFSYAVRAGYDATVRNTICAFLGAGVLLFLIAYGEKAALDAQENSYLKSPGRFFLCYTLCLIFALFITFVPWTLWPYTAVFVLMTLSSDRVTGVYAGSFFLLLSTLFVRDNAFSALGACLIAGFAAAAVFGSIEKGMRILAPLVTVLLIEGVVAGAFDLIFLHAAFSVRALSGLFLHLALSAVLLFLIVRTYTVCVLDAECAKYPEITDTEFSLMAAIRTKSKEEYFRAIHTAYLSERAALKMGLDAPAAKTLAMYKRIGCLDHADSIWGEVAHYFTEFEFPERAQELLREYITMGKRGPQSKEATVVFMCDALVSSLEALFQKNKEAQPDYDGMIDRLFEQKRSSGEIAESALAIREYLQLCAVLKQEKLYYDLLR